MSKPALSGLALVEWLISGATAFALIAPVELPDKTFVATLVLTTRYRSLPVWLGVAAAFAVQCGIAVAAGSLLGLLPTMPVRLVAAGLFAVGALVLLRSASKGAVGRGEAALGADCSADRTEQEQEAEYRERLAAPGATPTSSWRAAGASFLVLFTAEWGDLSQLLTAGLVASGEPPLAVFAGAWAALATVSGAAVLLGRWLLRHVRLTVVRYVAAGVCATLAVLTAVSALR